jgi:hypothetical protein
VSNDVRGLKLDTIRAPEGRTPSKGPHRESVKRPENPYVDVDYGILCRLFDSTTGQIAFLAVGTQTFGTEGAANFLFYPELFSSLIKQEPSNWESKNIQAVIRVSVIGTTPSTRQLVASYFW